MSALQINLEAEINPAEVLDTIEFHSKLNPSLWAGNVLRPEVRVRLLRASVAFYRFLELPGLRLADIVVTGSNAAFNYTPLSDIDVHLVVDYSRTTCPEWAENFFSTKKTLWNLTHAITIRGQATEMYVEDTRTPAYSNGVYSLLRGQWVRHAEAKAPSWDDAAILRKTEHLADEIDALISGAPDQKAVAALLLRLKRMRQSGLATGGEFSVENLSYKALRALGYLDRLHDTRTKAEDDSISLPEARRA